jgi:hypothetical protein
MGFKDPAVFSGGMCFLSDSRIYDAFADPDVFMRETVQERRKSASRVLETGVLALERVKSVALRPTDLRRVGAEEGIPPVVHQNGRRRFHSFETAIVTRSPKGSNGNNQLKSNPINIGRH